MPVATDILRKEHDAILKMLDAAETIGERLMRGEKVPDSTLTFFAEFFQEFADRSHHGKEEQFLFPEMLAKGLPEEGGPIGVMLEDHAMGREFIRGLNQARNAYRAGAPEAAAAWARAAISYSAFLRQHILKENEVLFVIAEKMLSKEEQRKMAENFERVDVERFGAGTREQLLARMEQVLREIG